MVQVLHFGLWGSIILNPKGRKVLGGTKFWVGLSGSSEALSWAECSSTLGSGCVASLAPKASPTKFWPCGYSQEKTHGKQRWRREERTQDMHRQTYEPWLEKQRSVDSLSSNLCPQRCLLAALTLTLSFCVALYWCLAQVPTRKAKTSERAVKTLLPACFPRWDLGRHC